MWSVGGHSDRAEREPDADPAVRQLQLRPTAGSSGTSGPIITANWQAASGERWTVPIGASVGRVFEPIGRQPVNVQLASPTTTSNARHGGADWQIRLQFQLLFPR